MTETVTNELGQTFPKPYIIKSTHGELDYTGSYGGREIICARLRWEPNSQEYRMLLEMGFHNLEWVSGAKKHEPPSRVGQDYRGFHQEGERQSRPQNQTSGDGEWLLVLVPTILAILFLVMR